MKGIILATLVGLVAAVELTTARYSSHFEWAQYKKLHGKVYGTPEEDTQRFALFLKAKKNIAEHNAKEQASHKLAPNHLSDLTEEEFSKMNGLRYDPVAHARRLESAKADPFLQALLDDSASVLAEVDWRKVPGRVSRVKDQSLCGSCWAFATTGLLEGQQVVGNFTKKLIALSEQDLVDCSTSDFGCEGGIMSSALHDIAVMGGIESEEEYMYVAPMPEQCNFDKTKVVMSNKDSVDLPTGEETLKKIVARYGPVAAAIEATESLKNYRLGVYDADDCNAGINHAVLVVGYGTDAKHGDYWIVKNSWGEMWGERGYFRMKRGKALCLIGGLSTVAEF